jgi:hypothetical protein
MSAERAVIFVEGTSDQVAVETLAVLHGRNLVAEGIAVVPIGGAHAIRRFAAQFDPNVMLTGLCDAGEAESFRRVLGDGFYVCHRDREDELIRALGAETVETIVDAHGDLAPFRTFQKQPPWQGRPKEDQLRRFMGSGGRRKLRYARFLVEALEPDQVPEPLARVLARV